MNLNREAISSNGFESDGPDIEHYGVLIEKLAILDVYMGTLEIIPYFNPFMRHQ